MNKILTITALATLLSGALACNSLCYNCDAYYNYCYTCVTNAYSINTSDCACYVDYYQSGGRCVFDGRSGLAGWAIILIVLGNLLIGACIIGCIVSCIRRRRQQGFGAYNRFGDPVAVAQPVIPQPGYGQPVYGNPTRPTNPIGSPVGYNQAPNPYAAANPYVAQPVCQICSQGNCDCQTSCGHGSHRACLDRWSHPTCPTCGIAIPELRK